MDVKKKITDTNNETINKAGYLSNTFSQGGCSKKYFFEDVKSFILSVEKMVCIFSRSLEGKGLICILYRPNATRLDRGH